MAVGELDEFDSGMVWASPNLVRLPNGRLALPYDGNRRGHEEGWFGTFYKRYDDQLKKAFAWALWDDGRLAGVEAQDYGEFWTEAALFEDNAIQLNARTARNGKIEMEIWDELAEEALHGFSFSEFIPFTGDEIWVPCQWKGDLATLRGRRIRLRFRLSCGKVFGYRFA